MRVHQLPFGHGHGEDLHKSLTEMYRGSFLEFMSKYESGAKEADFFEDYYRGRYRVQVGGDAPEFRDLFQQKDTSSSEVRWIKKQAEASSQLRWFYQCLHRVEIEKRMLWCVYSFIALPWLTVNAERSVRTFCHEKGIQICTDEEAVQRRKAEWANVMDKAEDHQRRKTA